MTALKREYFENSYESDASASWLVITARSGLKVLEYQVEMIARNNIEYILPFHIRKVNDKINFYYNITSKLSLVQFLARKKIGTNEFMSILLDICRAILDSRNYLLNDRCFLVDENMIHINPATLEISMPYIPAAYDADINIVLKDFVLNLILHLVSFEEERNSRCLQKILSFLKSDTFNAAFFRDFLNELAMEGDVYVSAANPEDPAPVNQNALKKEKTWGKTKMDRYAKKGRPSMRLPVTVISLQAAAAIIAVSSGLIKLKGQGTAVTYMAIVMIIAAFDVLLFKSIIKKGGLVKKAENKEENENKDTMESQLKPDKKAGETLFLVPQDDAHPFLSSLKQDEKIIVYETDFIIGRLEGQVDCVLVNKAVGKVHARIISRGGLYYLIDLNSKNGTFINDIRIDSNKEHEIKSGDRVSFANSHYIFTAACQGDGVVDTPLAKGVSTTPSP